METEQTLSQAFIRSQPVAAVRLLEALPINEIAGFLKDLPLESTAAVIRVMDVSTGALTLQEMGSERSASVLKEMSLDLSALFCRRMNTDYLRIIMEDLPEAFAGQVRLLLSHPEGTAGALMDPRILCLPRDIDAGSALDRVRAQASEALYYLYVVDDDRVLVGVLNMRELLLATAESRISGLMRPPLERLSVRAGFLDILEHPGWLKVHALPVVDSAGRFLGAVRYETLRRIEIDVRTGLSTSGLQAVSSALGELYRIGLAGLLRSASAVDTPPSR